jgi:putative transposase
MIKTCWYQLAQFIIYKAKGAGKWVEFVSPYLTSKRCSACGKINQKLGSKEIFTCPSCSYQGDRDVNAAKNIREKGIKKLGLSQRLGTLLTESV